MLRNADQNHDLCHDKMVHTPVLLNEVIAFLKPQKEHLYVDATFGGGGYSRAILDSCQCSVIAIDRDIEAQKRALAFEKQYHKRFAFILSNFSEIEVCLKTESFAGIVFDFGVSSFQLETPERGFSFQVNGPLDMRMGSSGITAEEVVNTYKEEELTEIIRVYGEERFARRISRAILKERKNHSLKTTFELANIVRSVVPYNGVIDPATKTFQAFRIFVNDELREIDTVLEKVRDLVLSNQHQQTRIITVTFHSLEDRIVKNWIHKNMYQLTNSSDWKIVNETPKVIKPSIHEIQQNPRSRSAKLRSIVLQRRERDGI